MSKILTPQVGIIMGSDSDLPVMIESQRVLEELQVSCEIAVKSAHRTPEEVFAYARSARERALKVIIAGAGGAAHLPGMVAALTPLPVIGVPVKSSTMSGLDSLYSIIQMPPGVPVATVAINGARNAGILAAQMIATGNEELLDRIAKFKSDLHDTVISKNDELQTLGGEEYLKKMDKK